MSKKSSTHGKTTDERPDPYRSRPADDGGMYLLLPRDEHLIPPLPDKPERVVIPWPEEWEKSEPPAP